jgi:hypothetical protein
MVADLCDSSSSNMKVGVTVTSLNEEIFSYVQKLTVYNHQF